jgi:hypothetical protein
VLSVGTADDEEVKEEDEESGHVDDEVDVDEINHTSLTNEAVRSNSPGKRAQREDIWKHVRSISRMVRVVKSVTTTGP